MNNEINDDAFVQRIRTTLEDSVVNLDSETRKSLAANHRNAFRAKPMLSLAFANLIPATAFAACVILAVLLTINMGRDDRGLKNTTDYAALQNIGEPLTLLELLTGEENQDVISDPGFYVWLDTVLPEKTALR